MTKDDIIRMARELGFEKLGRDIEGWVCFTEEIEHFAHLVAKHEREECAKLCESHVRYPARLHFAAAIRARSNHD